MMLRTVAALVRKEFYQIRRDPLMLRMIFIVPVVQMFVLAYAISTDVKNIPTDVYDYDSSTLSRELVRSMAAGGYFIPSAGERPLLESDTDLVSGEKSAVLIIPPGFSRDLTLMRPAAVGFVLDGANANSASIASGYANLITRRYVRSFTRMDLPIQLAGRVYYNPEGESVYFIVPGIVAVLLTMITMLLTSLAIVREREKGTLEQLMVTPIRTPSLILGKTIPVAILGYLEMSLALAIGIFWFDIPFAGSWPLLYGLAFIYLLTTQGIGMFISTMTGTQQQAMFFTWFFAIFTILTSGFFIPIENMPGVVQKLTYINPLRYFITIVRGIMMKGAGIHELRSEALSLVVLAVFSYGFAWMRFSKRMK
jgi:ABC-2 type transport system permease protein